MTIIGLNSCRLSMTLRRCSTVMPRSFASSTMSSSLVGRNSWRAGQVADGHRALTDLVHGLKEIRSADTAEPWPKRPCGPLRRGLRSSRHSLDAVGFKEHPCSVRHRPMPSAPNSTACLASRGFRVGKHFSLRAASAQPMKQPKSPEMGLPPWARPRRRCCRGAVDGIQSPSL